MSLRSVAAQFVGNVATSCTASVRRRSSVLVIVLNGAACMCMISAAIAWESAHRIEPKCMRHMEPNYLQSMELLMQTWPLRFCRAETFFSEARLAQAACSCTPLRNCTSASSITISACMLARICSSSVMPVECSAISASGWFLEAVMILNRSS
jgi:hypothetical protein